MPLGHELSFLDISATEIDEHPRVLSQVMAGHYSGLIVRAAYSEEQMQLASARLQSEQVKTLLHSPNQGMPGGELQTLGAAATPTLTALNGPSKTVYAASSQQAEDWQKLIFGNFDMNQSIASLFSKLYEQKNCQPAPFQHTEKDQDSSHSPINQWLPFNYRIMPVGVQIYSHHDLHYRLPIYQNLSAEYDKSMLFSWFITTQAAEQGGELIVYGLTSDDPNPPLLPTRFVDTGALEKDYYKAKINLDAGDLILFNSGRYVHRVNQVGGSKARMTIGGFLTRDKADTHLVYWS